MKNMNPIYERIWHTSEDGLIQCVLLTKHRLKETLDMLHKGYFMQEKLSKAVGLSQHHKAIREFDDMLINIAMDGVSIVAKDKTTGKIIGCALNKIYDINNTTSFLEKLKMHHPSAQAYKEVFIELDRKLNIFDLLKINCYVENTVTAVLPEFRDKRVATALHNASTSIMQHLINRKNVKVSLTEEPLGLDSIPTGAIAYITHGAIKRLANSLDYKIIKEIDLRNFVFKSKLLNASVLSKIPPIVLMYRDYCKGKL